MHDTNPQLQSLEQRTRKLERWLIMSIGLWLITFGVIAVSAWSSAQTPQTLKASELVIVDSKGIERARISGDLPDPLINGKRVPRGEKAAGVLLYDGTGQERSGYVTFEPSGNVGLTLDTRNSRSPTLSPARIRDQHYRCGMAPTSSSFVQTRTVHV